VCERWGARAGFLVAGVTALLAAVPFLRRLAGRQAPAPAPDEAAAP
jgi:hypothetical protein